MFSSQGLAFISFLLISIYPPSNTTVSDHLQILLSAKWSISTVWRFFEWLVFYEMFFVYSFKKNTSGVVNAIGIPIVIPITIEKPYSIILYFDSTRKRIYDHRIIFTNAFNSWYKLIFPVLKQTYIRTVPSNPKPTVLPFQRRRLLGLNCSH